MSRSEFPASVRKAAWKRADGICECGCGQPFDLNHPKGCPVFDHELPDFLGGTNDLENCKCVRWDCHHTKTVEKDLPRIKKVRRETKKRTRTGAKKRSSFSTNRDGKFKAKIGGGIEPR